MSEKYIVFDVETPNSANDRMSAIGLAVVEGNRIVEEFSTLINPEVYFNRFNIQLTGISPEDVVDAPTFSDLWPSLKCMLEGESDCPSRPVRYERVGQMPGCLRDLLEGVCRLRLHLPNGAAVLSGFAEPQAEYLV